MTRITIELSQKAERQLRAAAKEHQLNIAEYIRSSVALNMYLYQQLKAGQKVILQEKRRNGTYESELTYKGKEMTR